MLSKFQLQSIQNNNTGYKLVSSHMEELHDKSANREQKLDLFLILTEKMLLILTFSTKCLKETRWNEVYNKKFLQIKKCHRFIFQKSDPKI